MKNFRLLLVLVMTAAVGFAISAQEAPVVFQSTQFKVH